MDYVLLVHQHLYSASLLHYLYQYFGGGLKYFIDPQNIIKANGVVFENFTINNFQF